MLRTVTAAAALAALAAPALSAQSVTDRDAQIASAVLAAPEDQRAGATVLGWTDEGTVVTLREGSNNMICLSDNPTQQGWSVACYPRSIDAYMARGRELRASGVTDGQETLRMRWQEADAGTLPMPEDPATVYIMHGQGFNAETGEIEGAFLRWAVYTPWATPESTGLPIQPTGPGAPWLMFPGTPGAHIMITPELPAYMRGGN